LAANLAHGRPVKDIGAAIRAMKTRQVLDQGPVKQSAVALEAIQGFRATLRARQRQGNFQG
jgi:hypothetical protein